MRAAPCRGGGHWPGCCDGGGWATGGEGFDGVDVVKFSEQRAGVVKHPARRGEASYGSMCGGDHLGQHQKRPALLRVQRRPASRSRRAPPRPPSGRCVAMRGERSRARINSSSAQPPSSARPRCRLPPCLRATAGFAAARACALSCTSRTCRRAQDRKLFPSREEHQGF